MKRKKSSKRWMDEHFSDQYVQRAKDEGFRGRAAYKLEELDKKHRLFKAGMIVVDLGAAPGSWSQVVVKKVGDKGKVIASDILEMEPIHGVLFVQGDFREDQVLHELQQEMGAKKADLVISDMAPNISGVASIDQPASIYLAELALDLCHRVLQPEGRFLVKLFQGPGFDEYKKLMRDNFSQVTLCKPKASRSRSREVYALAQGLKL